MLREVLYASDFLDKDVLDLDSGDLIGKITGLLVEEEPLRVVAFAYRAEDEVQHLAFCDLEQVTDIDQQVVVIASTQAYLPSDVRNILGLSCLDAKGHLVGKIRDLSWNASDRKLLECVIEGEEAWFGIAISDIGRLGSGAVVLNVEASGIHKRAYERPGAKEEGADSTEEVMRTLIKRVGATLAGAGQKVGEKVKQIDTEELNRDINRFTEKVGKEIRNVIDTISEQSKASKYATMESEAISVLRDLEGFSVTTAIYSQEGEALITPGQTIDADVVRRVIEADKVAELYRVAVSIKNGDADE